MTIWLSAGILFSLASILFILTRWGSKRCVGITPVNTFVFLAILFTSGLDIGLIMLPLTEFASYADLTAYPEYAFANPLSIEFGFWGFLIWSFYFITCFYFCIIEQRVRFFERSVVKLINNVVIIGTCAFTAYLLLVNLPWYLPTIGDGERLVAPFYGIVFLSICAAVYSSTSLKYIRFLSLATSVLFFGLIALMWLGAMLGNNASMGDLITTITLIGNYFQNLHQFVLPLNDYHAFYLSWWFAWSIMIGQFTARFVGGLKTCTLLAAMLIVPSVPLAIWFAVLYYYHINGLDTSGVYNLSMAFVGVTFVINSLDSLVRLYSDNLNLTVKRLGKTRYIIGNIVALSLLTLLFRLDFLQIQWVGALVIGIFFTCFGSIILKKRADVAGIATSNSEQVGRVKLSLPADLF